MYTHFKKKKIGNSLNILKTCKDNKAGSPFVQQELKDLTSKSTFEHSKVMFSVDQLSGKYRYRVS